MAFSRALPRQSLRLLLALASLFPPAAEAAGAPLRVQLKWYHQFQFAGFYAAQEQGFYAEEGLEVELVEGSPERSTVKEVLEGRAEIGVSDTGVLVERLAGRPLVALGAIFQHDPHVLASLRSSGIARPSDLAGKRVMVTGDEVSAAAINAMIRSEGVPFSAIRFLPHSWDYADLRAGRVDAMSGYATDLERQGVDYRYMRPSDYSIDFYGDVLFSTERFVRGSRERAAAFARASFRGWDYAMSHPEELAAFIAALPGVAERGLTRESLLAEARALAPYVAADIVEPGHMNPGRWERIAETYRSLGLVKDTKRLEGFLFDPAVDSARFKAALASLVTALAVLVAALFLFLSAKKTLQALVLKRTSELVALNAGLEAEVGERRRAEGALRSSLQEKEVLLREVYHRVKNNLQVVTSLISLKIDEGEGEETKRALEETRDRVYAMSLVHELLYASPELSRIDAGRYVARLCGYLLSSRLGGPEAVSIDTRVDSVELGLEKAIPLGLIVNELVSNALKHALPPGAGGRILVVLESLPGARIRLSVSDDGPGLPPGFDPALASGLGLRVVASLSAQLGGKLSSSSEGGATFIVELPLEEAALGA